MNESEEIKQLLIAKVAEIEDAFEKVCDKLADRPDLRGPLFNMLSYYIEKANKIIEQDG